MGLGLYVADANGKTLLDTSVRCLKILGSFLIPAGSESVTFTATHPELSKGTLFYYAQGNCFNLKGYYVTVPVAMYDFTPTVSGNTLTMVCDYAGAFKNKWNRTDITSVDVRIYYGVY